MISPSIAMTNNYQPENHKKPSMPLSQTPSLLSFEDGNFQKTESHHDYTNFLQHGAALIDRPFGAGLQPLDAMEPVLMKLNICEQHWIKFPEK
jgi:hypothetical protein